MKKVIYFSIACLLTSLIMSTNSMAEAKSSHTLNRIVAVINDEVVTQNELDHAYDLDKQQYLANNMTIPPTLKKQVLEQLINKKLQLQLAKRNNINATEKEIETAIERIAQQNHITSSELKAKLLSMGVDDKDYHSQIKDQIIITKLEQKAVGGNFTVTKEDFANFKKQYAQQDTGNTQYHLADTLIAFSSDPSPSEIADKKQKAKTLLENLRKNPQMTQNSENSEDMGWRRLSDLPSLFANSVASMKVGEIIGPIQAPNGFHLLKLLARNGQPRALSKDELQNFVFQQKFEQEVNKWLSQIRKAAFIKIEAL